MRKRNFVLVLLLILGLLAFAAGQGETPQVEEGPEGAVEAKGAVQINVICWAGVRSEGPVRGLAKDYEAMEPSIKINVEAGPWEDFNTRIAFDVSSGTNAYDLVWFDPKFLGGYVKAGYVEPLEKYIMQDPEWWQDYRSDIYPQLLDGPYRCILDDRWYGLPQDGNAAVFYYRKDVLSKVGITKAPETWEEVFEVAEKIHNPPNMYAIGGMYRGFWAFDTYMSYLYSAGGRLWDPESKVPRINDAAALRAGEVYLEAGKWVPKDAFNWGEELCFEALAKSGSVAMVPASWANPIPTDPNLCRFADDMGVSVIPKLDGKRGPALGGFFWMIGARSTKEVKQETWEFMKFYMSRDNNAKAIEYGAQPIRISALNHPKAVELGKPYYSVLAEALSTAVARPTDPEFIPAEQIIGKELVNVLMGKKTMKEALDATQKEYWKIMVQSGRFRKEWVPAEYRW